MVDKISCGGRYFTPLTINYYLYCFLKNIHKQAVKQMQVIILTEMIVDCKAVYFDVNENFNYFVNKKDKTNLNINK